MLKHPGLSNTDSGRERRRTPSAQRASTCHWPQLKTAPREHSAAWWWEAGRKSTGQACLFYGQCLKAHRTCVPKQPVGKAT